MARVGERQPLTPSVLDRLIDERPDESVEAPGARHLSPAGLRAAVRRDLEHLLNTRQRSLSWPEELTGLDRSLVGYGVPDFTGRNLVTADARAEFLASVRRILQRCEPRFASVKVVPIESPDPLDRHLRFRIDALLRAEPVPEAVVFDSIVEPVSRTFEIKV